jgi:ABC-type Zn2+ transport system substrate-binding protein/surface adhesin
MKALDVDMDGKLSLAEMNVAYDRMMADAVAAFVVDEDDHDEDEHADEHDHDDHDDHDHKRKRDAHVHDVVVPKVAVFFVFL